jgi:MerR family transcriptional regulator, light-induced transcriptional regulator
VSPVAVTPSAYPIRVVSRLTGISIDTLRAWERRYGAVVPERGARGRIYRDAHVARLKRLDALVRRGHPIGTIARLEDGELARLVEEQSPPPPGAADLSELLAALDRFDLRALDAALNRFATLLPPRELIARAVLPLLRELGVRWDQGTLTPAQEHMVSALVRTVLGSLLRTAPPGSEPAIVFATPQGERHELGLLAGAVLTAQSGFRVIYLGSDLPADEIAAVATRAGAAAIVMGLTVGGADQIARLSSLAGEAVLFVGGRTAAVPRGPSRLHLVGDVLDLPLELSRRLS